jgi:hypothetical protein
VSSVLGCAGRFCGIEEERRWEAEGEAGEVIVLVGLVNRVAWTGTHAGASRGGVESWRCARQQPSGPAHQKALLVE